MADKSLSFSVFARAKAAGFGTVARETETIRGSFGKLAAVMGGVFAVNKVVDFAKSTVNAASDLNESVNAVQQIFGKFSGRMETASKVAYKAGLSQRQFNEAIVPLGALLKNAGLPMDTVSGQTLKLMQRAEDMASVFNTSVPDALEALQAGLRGESDPLERYGVSLTAAAVQAEALGETHKKTAKELTNTELATARINLIMRQTSATAGDFKRTSGGLANQQRILSAEWENAKAQLGTAVLPLLSSLARVGSTVLIPMLQNAFTWVRSNAGTWKRDLTPAWNTAVSTAKTLVTAGKATTAWLRDHMTLTKSAAAGIAGMVVAYKTASTATKTFNTVSGILNSTLGKNPYVRIALLIIGIGTALVTAYKSSETFRNVVKTVFKDVELAFMYAGKFAIQYLLIPVLNVYSAIVHGAASAFGWVPGIGGKLKKARSAFDNFRKGVDSALHGINVQIDTIQAGKAIAHVRDMISQLRSKKITLSTYIQQTILPTLDRSRGGVYGEHSGPGRAQGGPVYKGRTYRVLEKRSELFTPSTDGYISPRVPGGRGGPGEPQQLEISFVGADSEFLRFIRKIIRVNGGDVQVVLGR